jgi:molecular chaperone GrpE
MNKEEEKKMPEPEAAGSAEPSPEAAAAPETETAQEPAADEENSATAEEPAAEEPQAEPDWKDRYARLLADFDNYRKRVARDREELAQFAAKDILKDLLPTVDNLALALEKAENKDDPFVQGVKLAYDGFLKALADHGATPIDSVGEPFDANYHEALAQLPSPDVAEGVIMNEVKRGWLLHGKLLRAAQVVVSSGAPEKPAENPAAEA